MPRKAAYCRECGAHILWAQRYGASAIPLDYEPIDDVTKEAGRYVIELSSSGVVYAVRAGYRPIGHSALYASHLDTCPKRANAEPDPPPPASPERYIEVVHTWVEPYGRWAIVWARYGSAVVPTVLRCGAVRFDKALPQTILKTGKVMPEARWPQYIKRQVIAGVPPALASEEPTHA